jgi:type IV secretion system protein VirB4
MEDALAVISASTDNIAVMHRVLQEEAERLDVGQDELLPEHWLPRFQQERKGARRAAPAHDSGGAAAKDRAGRTGIRGAAPLLAPSIKEEWR